MVVKSMDASDQPFSDLVSFLKSLMAWRQEPAHVSRDFWMPDQSCRVCYECDSLFTLFNRRHHCRLCGRIFCSKCTSNWLPTQPSEEDLDKIRVCNYCFKQRQKGEREKALIAVVDNEVDLPELGNATSASSFVSTRSSGTCISSSATFVSLPQASVVSQMQPPPFMEVDLDRQNVGGAKSNIDSGEHLEEQKLSENQFGYFHNRSYDDEEFGSYYDPVQYEDTSSDYKSSKLDPNGDAVNSRNMSISSHDSQNFKESQHVPREEIENDISEECETSSSLYVAEDINIEPVDFENNGVLWFPPEPEDEEDEREAYMFEEDDEEAAGEFTYSSSSGSGEFRREKTNEKAMKNVVEGHFRALVAQLLQVDDLLSDEENDEENWLDIIIALSWEAATLLKPDMSKGGQMDPGSYVKVKCLASGLRSQSEVVRGVVCKKNIAHRRMKARIEKPRMLILGGALEYQRVSNALSSFDTLLQQEMDHLKMAVAKISVHNPNILLVEKSVSRYAQEYLLAKEISLVLNIKKPLLERIARCTGAQIVPTIDRISSENVGYCDLFHVMRFTEEHWTADQPGKKLVKNLMYFEGCPKPQGFTILLRGASGDELKKVKHVIQYGVFAAYHLALETSFLADEGASLPDKQSAIEMCISTLPGVSGDRTPALQSVGDPNKSNPVPSSDLIKEALASIHEYKNSGYQNSSLNQSSSPNTLEDRALKDLGLSVEAKPVGVDGVGDTNLENADEEDLPPPSDLKSILVSLSSRCVWKGTVCERAHLFRVKYYGSFDKPLGRFLRDHLFDRSFVCRSCEMPAEAHIQCYTHRQGSLTISVKKLPEIILPGENDGKIWMWHRCLRCPRANGYPPATRRVLMSDAAWGLSFGKFLELSFSNHAAASRVASCGHSLHRDCLRFYGFGQMVACFRYASIDVHSVYLPPAKLEMSYKKQEWIEKEVNEVVGRAELLFSEVLNALRLLAERKCGAEVHEASHLITKLEGLLQKEKSLFEERLRMVLKTEAEIGQPLVDILELNGLRRELIFQSYVWDRRLIYAASLDSNDHPTKGVATSKVTIHKPLGETEKILDINVSSSEENHDHSQSRLLNNPLEAAPQTTDLSSNSNHGNQNRLDSDSSLNGQPPKSLYDTLDAAWTGEGGPPIGFPKKCIVCDNLSTKSDVENERKDSASVSPIKSCVHDDEDETESWLKTPFSIYYRSSDKDYSGPDLTLDILSGYNPVYISSFQDPELQGGARLLLQTGVNDIVIPVYDDEPTSLISYALVSRDYFRQLSDEPKGNADSMLHKQPSLDSGAFPTFSSLDEMMLDSYKTFGPGDEGMLTSFKNSLNSDPVSCTKAVHARVSFTDDGPLGKVKYDVTCYYARCFESLRRISCPSEVDFVRSLSRCKKWGAQGGKSNVFFAKTLDDRFIIKQVTKTELESFIKFAPSYFNYISEAIGTRSPTCLAKILGIYQVSSKHAKGGKETKMDVLVMENLLFRRNITCLYDLKGSTRSRYNPDSSGSNKVLLDQNLIEAMPTSPIFVGNKAKRVLERAVWNDTAFLASIDVMDYSLLVGVDEEKHELVIGTIDFMRQYTWDKHLETWVKASGILGGSKNAPPTVISPKQYKIRFRKAMTTYFLMVPDQWSPPMIHSQPQMEMVEENLVEEGT